MDRQPSLDEFAEELIKASWYDVGVFLGTPARELKRIEEDYGTKGTTRCLSELYGYLERAKGDSFVWRDVVNALRRMRYNGLAEKIVSKCSSRPPPPAVESRHYRQSPVRSTGASDGHHSAERHTESKAVVEDHSISDRSVAGSFINVSQGLRRA